MAIIELNSDITDRVKIERERQRALDQLEEAERVAGLGSWRFHPASGAREWSAGLYLLHDLDRSQDPPETAELLPRIHPDDRERFEEVMTRIRSGLEAFRANYRLLTPDGEVREMQLIVDQDSSRPGWYRGTLQDVTRAGQIERALREQTDRAEQANLAKSEFMSRMSHELRTPLNAISGFSQLLQMTELARDQAESIRYVLSAADHLLSLINDLLDISRVEAGQMKISPEAVPLAPLVAEAASLMQPLAAERHVALRAEVSALRRDTHVHADSQRLKQVLLNVISNAIKYNHENGHVTITAATAQSGARVAITDTGIGVDPEQMPLLFEPFERLGAESTAIEGTGLGLALSKALIELMGGTISARSEPGRGTEFIIDLLPADSPHGRQLPAVPERPSSEPVSTATRASVLYIEDNLSNLRLMERILTRHRGWSVELLAAMQGSLGLDLARKHLPDVILLDLHLPDGKGEDLLRNLKSDPVTTAIPVVVLTADATPGLELRLKRLGAAAFLTKPLDVRRLIEVLSDWLDER